MFNPRLLLGLTIETARVQAREHGYVIEEQLDQPDTFLFPMSYKQNRINVKVTQGIVTEIIGNG